MYLGRYQLGQFLRVVVQTVDAGGLAAWPAEAPTVEFWDGATRRVPAKPIPARDRPASVGVFEGLFFLNTNWAVSANWSAVARYSLGGPAVAVRRFEVVEGGDAGGAIIAMTDLTLPATQFIVCETDAATLLRRKNPYLA